MALKDILIFENQKKSGFHRSVVYITSFDRVELNTPLFHASLPVVILNF